MKLIIKTLLKIVIVILFISCEENGIFGLDSGQETTENVFYENFGNLISRDFIGKVVDKAMQPISGANVLLGDKVAVTDKNGVFIIKEAIVRQYFAYIKVIKSGYINGSRTVIPTEGVNRVTIMMLNDLVTKTITSGTSETVFLQDGSFVTFNGAYVNKEGIAYTGSVDVIIKNLNPSDANIADKMPGMLYGEDKNGEESILKSFGTLAIELRGSNGEYLNIASDSSAEIAIAVDVALQGITPSTLPLWYFDYELGYWKEEGQATLEGNLYIGTISHFSTWSVDTNFQTLRLCINVTDANANAIANQKIVLNPTNNNYPFRTTYGYTNNSGQICGLIVFDEALELRAYSCSTVIYNLDIGSITLDSEIDIVIPDNEDVVSETIVSNFTNCDGNIIINAYAQITYNGEIFFDLIEGESFEVSLLRCANELSFYIEGNDYDSLQTTGPLKYTYITPLTDLGNLSICGTN